MSRISDTPRNFFLISGVSLVILLALAGVSFVRWGDFGLNIWETVLGTLLTSALVGLYAYQAVIQKEQLEIMDYQKRVAEQQHAPHLEVKIVEQEGEWLICEVRNTGQGVAANNGLIFHENGTSLSDSRISYFERIDDNPALIRPNTTVKCKVYPEIRRETDSGGSEDLSLQKYAQKMVEMGDKSEITIRKYSEDLADSGSSSQPMQVIQISQEGSTVIEKIVKQSSHRFI